MQPSVTLNCWPSNPHLTKPTWKSFTPICHFLLCFMVSFLFLLSIGMKHVAREKEFHKREMAQGSYYFKKFKCRSKTPASRPARRSEDPKIKIVNVCTKMHKNFYHSDKMH